MIKDLEIIDREIVWRHLEDINFGTPSQLGRHRERRCQTVIRAAIEVFGPASYAIFFHWNAPIASSRGANRCDLLGHRRMDFR
jgi:hypothetical protein